MGLLRALFVSMVLGCLPQRHGYEGFACDADNPCPDDLVCRSSVCMQSGAAGGAAAAGGSAGGLAGGSAGSSGGGGGSSRMNLMRNPGFEEQGIPPDFTWTPTGGLIAADLQTFRSGAKSMRIGSPTTAIRTAGTPAVRFAPLAGTYCAELWMLGTGTARLSLEFDSALSGGGSSVDRAEANAALTTSSWVPLRNRVNVDTAVVGSTVVLTVSPSPSQWVDDVAVWHSPTGNCQE